MSRMHVLIIRASLGVLFGVLVAHLFYPNASKAFVIGLCIILVGLSYVTEYLHDRNKKN